MQFFKFNDGSYVIHKITYKIGKLSAWFDNNGELVDIEKFDRNGRKTGSGIDRAKEFAQARYGKMNHHLNQS